MRVCVIPARGGSKRIPRKNIRLFAGRPMISYAIEAAIKSGFFDKIIVSTDDDEISNISKYYGAETPFRRPATISDDHATTREVLAHAISWLDSEGFYIDLACCIYPCVPLLEPKDLLTTLELLENSSAKYSFPITAFPSPIQRALRIDDSGRTKSFYPEYESSRTQDLMPTYYDAGQFYWGWKDAWLAGIPIHSNGVGIPIPNWRVVDIDNMDDWYMAEKLWNVLHSKS